MKSRHDGDLTPEAFFARQRRLKRVWLAIVIAVIAIVVAALL